jgi:antitoxin HicB
MSTHMQYPALFEPAPEGGFIVTIPDFDWGVSQGDTEDEALEMATALLQTLVQEHIRGGQALPRPTRPRGRRARMIRLPALQAAKAELYRAFLESGDRKADLARRLGVPKTSVDRLFDLRHRSRLDQIEAAFKALGKDITIYVQDAA